jgi:hypothetical protein
MSTFPNDEKCARCGDKGAWRADSDVAKAVDGLDPSNITSFSVGLLPIGRI